MRHPGGVLTALIFLGAAGAISVNALTLQDAPHPAPLFASSDSAPSVSASPPSRETAPQRPANTQAPAHHEQAAPAQQQQETAAGPQSINDLIDAPLPPARPDSIDQGDPIGALLRNEDGPSVTGSTNPQTAPGIDQRVLRAQKALNAIGYGDLTEDGLMGPMTRDAIIRFERDQGLDPDGALDADTLHALARASGIALD